jgi:hypothetical protein
MSCRFNSILYLATCVWLFACAACWVHQGVGNHRPMRATINIDHEALPTLGLLAPRISSNRFKEMQFSHSETVAGCTAPMDAIACLRSLLGSPGYRKVSIEACIHQYWSFADSIAPRISSNRFRIRQSDAIKPFRDGCAAASTAYMHQHLRRSTVKFVF